MKVLTVNVLAIWAAFRAWNVLSKSVPSARQVQPTYPDPNGILRPQLHFSPPENWMNDPNGPFFYNGLYHLYYQWSYTSVIPNNPAWGHATSPDLFTWTQHPVAIYNTTEEAIFSGNIVLDTDNTSGLFPGDESTEPNVVAIYTSHYSSTAIEAQSLAVSPDGGETFAKYSGNPVLNFNQQNFRDPKVFWDTTRGEWVMLVSQAAESLLQFYASPDLIHWTFLSDFTINDSSLSGSWECPSIAQTKILTRHAESGDSTFVDGWILMLSTGEGNPLFPGYDLNAVRWFPGQWNGSTFTPLTTSTTNFMDFGPDYYAASFFTNIPTSAYALSVAWAAGLRYATLQPEGDREGWRGVQTTPRQNYIYTPDDFEGGRQDWRLFSRPSDLDTIRNTILADSSSTRTSGSISTSYSTSFGGVLIEVALNTTNITSLPAEGLDIAITSIASGTMEEVVTSLNLSPTGLSLVSDRSAALGGWVPPANTLPPTMALSHMPEAITTEPRWDTWTVQILVDRSIMEVFVNGGEQVGTMRYWPASVLDTASVDYSDVIEAQTRGVPVEVHAKITGLKNGWAST